MVAELQKIKMKLRANPETIFLIDGFGALLTALLLLGLVIPFSTWFGMPNKALYWLFGVACVLSLFSFYCAHIKTDQWKSLLTPIVAANCAYCILTAALLISSRETVSLLGWIYFTGEVMIIVGLVCLEVAMIKQLA